MTKNTTNNATTGNASAKKGYFDDCKTLEDVKATYKELVKKLHPDCNPDKDTTKDFQKMSAQYKKAFNALKNIHVTKDGKKYEKETDEKPSEFADIIEALIHLKGINVELCGSWLWVTGDTKPCKDVLKTLKFFWSHNKNAWYYHREDGKRKSSHNVPLEKIREMYGSINYSNGDEAQAALA